MGLVSDVFGEGLRIPPVHLVRAGQVQRDVEALVLANVRTPRERRADLLAQIGAQTTGERRLQALIRDHSRAWLRAGADALIDYAARCTRAALAEIPRGRWRFADALDDDGLGHGPIPIVATVVTRDGRLIVDFTGSHPQTAGPVNAPLAVTRAAVTYAVRIALGGDFPVNHGSLGCVEVLAPPGTVVHAMLPAAVAGGNVETSQRIVDVVLGALAQALPKRIPAASYGTMTNLLIGGTDPRTGSAFSYYETLGGGHGAGPGWHGASGLQAHMTNTRNTPVEALEHSYPLHVRSTRIRRGSGGRGRFRGGDGIERTLELRARARVTVLSDRRRGRPYGLAGGGPGSSGVNRVQARRGSVARRMPGKFVIDLDAGALLTVASPGGGGHGRSARRARR
jgi:N-methylhydantoinase B